MKSYKEIVKLLKKPIEKEFISQKKQGGATIKFVNVTDIKDLLDQRMPETVWESSVKSVNQIGENLVMIVSVAIHASDGIFTQEGTGVESVNLKGYGDVASNAYAQAFRRACESHGLARELWRMELSQEQKEINQENQNLPPAKPVSLNTQKHRNELKEICQKLNYDSESITKFLAKFEGLKTENEQYNAVVKMREKLKEYQKLYPAENSAPESLKDWAMRQDDKPRLSPRELKSIQIFDALKEKDGDVTLTPRDNGFVLYCTNNEDEWEEFWLKLVDEQTVCDCTAFKSISKQKPEFKCEHINAVNNYLDWKAAFEAA